MNRLLSFALSCLLSFGGLVSVASAHSYRVVTLNRIVPFAKTWMEYQDEIKYAINNNANAIYALPSDDYGTAQFISDFDQVKQLYETLQSYQTLLNIQTAKTTSFIEQHRFTKDERTVIEFSTSINKIDLDFNLAVYQIGRELNGEESLIKQFNNGSHDPHVPYWTFDAFNSVAANERSQNIVALRYYARILSEA